MDVLVTGATGFIGRQITIRLCAAGHRVRILVRDAGSLSAQELASRAGVTPCRGDVLAPESLLAAMNGCTTVIHLVGIISEAGRATFENMHTLATENVLAAAQSAGAPRFVHMSALGTRPRAASRYHQTKWAAEECVRASGLAWTIFRPSLVYGPEDHLVNLFASVSRFSPVLPLLGPGTARFQPVAVETVAEAFTGSLVLPGAEGKTLDLCGPDTLTFRQILKEILAAVHRRRWIMPIPLPLARLQADVLQILFARLLKRPPPLNRDQLIMLQEDNVGDGAPAQSIFDLKQSAFREGIRRYLQPVRR